MSIGTPHPRLVLAALITVQVLFGINYVVSKIVVDEFPPLVWASFRIIVSAVIMMAAAFLLKRPHPALTRKFFIPLIGLALLGTIINQACFLVGLHYTTSTNSAILNTLIPVFTLMVVTIRGQEPATFKRVVGFISALLGVLVLRRVEDFTLSDQTLFGDLLMILNCLSYALFLSYSKKFFQENDRMWTTAWLFVYGSFGITAIAAPDIAQFQMPVMTDALLAASVFAIVGGTLLTYFLNNWALAYANSSHVALYIYVQPVITAVLVWWWFDEPITARMVLASLFIFVGMVLGLSTPKKPSLGRIGARG